MQIKNLISSKSIICYQDEEFKLYDLVKLIDRKIIQQCKERMSYKNFAIFLPNSAQYMTAYFTIASLDKVIVPIPTMAKQAEVLSTLEYCEVGLIFTNTYYQSILLKFLEKFKFKVEIFNIEDNSIISVGHRVRSLTSSTISVPSEDDVAIMLHTSGTTSDPKRVMLTHKNLFSNVYSNIKSLNLTDQDRTLISLPMFFGYCNTAQMLTHLYLGASIVIMDGLFLPMNFFKLVEEKKITNYTGVPSILIPLLNYRNWEKYNTSSLRYICFGGGNMPIDKLKLLMDRFPQTGFVQTYGQTEASPRVTALLPRDSTYKLGSVGKPIPDVEIRLVDEEGIDVIKGEIGEILVRGNNVMKGYYKQPEITEKTIKDGWLYTGDLAVLDEDEFLFLKGRKKNLIISGGLNIYPEEIEELLLSHPAVKEAYVYGRPHDLLGEVPYSKLVLYDDYKEIITPDEFVNFCHEQLASFKVPVQIFIVYQLKKTKTGKIKRHREDITS